MYVKKVPLEGFCVRSQDIYISDFLLCPGSWIPEYETHTTRGGVSL